MRLLQIAYNKGQLEAELDPETKREINKIKSTKNQMAFYKSNGLYAITNYIEIGFYKSHKNGCSIKIL
jgi:hypothetical protein